MSLRPEAMAYIEAHTDQTELAAGEPGQHFEWGQEADLARQYAEAVARRSKREGPIAQQVWDEAFLAALTSPSETA